MLHQAILQAFLLILSVSRTQSAFLRAELSVGGVRGSVTFGQTSPGANVTVTFVLSGRSLPAASSLTWELRKFRVNFDIAQPCSDSSLGQRVLPTVGTTVSNRSVSGFDLSGAKSIEGLSVLLVNGSKLPLACATVENTGSYVTARAVFRRAVLGTVIFRQVAANSSGAATRLVSDLYFDGSRLTNQSLDWRIVESSGECSTLPPAFSPTGVFTTNNCTSNHLSCAVGDLSGKLGRVAVGSTPSSARLNLLDLNLPLSGPSSVTAGAKRLVLYQQGQSTPMACADVRVFQTRTGIAEFSNDGVKGSIFLTQNSPFDPVVAAVNLTNLAAVAGGYHVHEWPVPQRVGASQLVCGASAVGGHYNPFGRDYKIYPPPAAATGTEDQYEVGDLSGKYGLLNALTEKTATYTDWNLQLFGPHSVLGRSLVIHKNLDGTPRWVCTNIRSTMATTYALATFAFPVIGHVLFQQPTGQADAETSVFVELDYADGSSNVTDGHAWGIHATSFSDDQLQGDVTRRCVSAGDVANPYIVSSASYTEQCAPASPLRCMLGDLGGKLGKLAVRTTAGERSIAFFTDVNLPLSGDDAIVGKSVVLMTSAGGGPRLACAKVLPVTPRVVSTRNGEIVLTQNVGLIQEPTFLYLNLTSLPAGDSRLQINNLPLSQALSCQNTGSVFNPFAVQVPSGASATLDLYPVGDISGKFGPVSSSTRSRVLVDSSLVLTGPRSAAGRAFSLTSSGNVGNCSDLTDVPRQGGMQVKAKAVFAGSVTGEIMLTQYIYSDGTMSDTTVTVNLKITSGTQTTDHNWHVHEYLVSGDANATSKRCASTGGHYNPFKVNVTANYQSCSELSPLRCELGDLSGKLGTYSMGSGLKIASDSFLPLAGEYGVTGRSIVVHASNKAGDRIACADIMPVETSRFVDVVIATPAQMNRRNISDTYADALSTGRYNIAVNKLQAMPNGCTSIRVFFLGLRGDENRQSFQRISGTRSMGPYSTTACNSALTPKSTTPVVASSTTCVGLDAALMLTFLITSLMAGLQVADD